MNIMYNKDNIIFIYDKRGFDNQNKIFENMNILKYDINFIFLV